MTSPRTTWLASYPKSGSTWVRAILTALSTPDPLFRVDQLLSGGQPFQVQGALAGLGVDPRWLDGPGLATARDSLIRLIDAEGAGTVSPETGPLVRKTHERYRPGPAGREPFPTAASRAAIVVVRDPRDVACSYAAFFDISLDDAVAALARDGGDGEPNAFRAQTEQPWGTWSSHARSWLDGDVPFPVHLVRYEDLHDQPVDALLPVLRAVGVACSSQELEAAIELSRFDRLRLAEEEHGFRETSPRTHRFFRQGRAGAWRGELTASQVRALEDAHADVMERLGYSLASRDWTYLPPALGIDVREGPLPSSLPGERRPTPWVAVAGSRALVSFPGGAGVLVEGGTSATVRRPAASEPPAGPHAGPAADPAWLVQGWAVTLAMLQRGLLSLHAATVEVNGRVIAVAGERGAGKSTTAMGLRGRGHRLLCDDVTVVEFRDGRAWTTPFWRNVHLLEDTAEAFGLDFAGLPPLGAHRRKVAFLPEAPPSLARPLDRIVVLAQGDPDDIVVRHQRGAERLEALVAHTRRDGVAPLILGEDRYFAEVARLADCVPVTVLTRPRGGWSLERVLDAIEGLGDAP